jgi:diacylglycerol O-acyltransferase / wax synthase
MDGLKESKQAVGAATLAAVTNLAPPTILAQASRLNFSTRLFNLLVTNIPGPQFPLYVLGRQLEDLFPLAFLPKNHALAVAIMSYNGGIDYGLLADYDALPDVEVIAEGIDAALSALLEAAARAGAQTPEPAPGSPVSSPGTSGNGNPRNGASSRILPSGSARTKPGPAADMRAKRGSRSARTTKRAPD